MKEDLVGKLGLTDSEVFIEPSYDPDASYANAQNADVERGGVSAMFCGNIYRGCSPAGKNTINLMVLQGYGHWERFERSYLAGEKAAYRKEKERMADVLIRKAEKALLPGLARPGERHTTAASEVVPERRLKRAGDQCVAAWMSGENLHRSTLGGRGQDQVTGSLE